MALMATSHPTLKFDTAGETFTCTIRGEVQERQQTDYASGAPLTWPDGEPRMQYVAPVFVDEFHAPDDDGHRTLYIKGRLTPAVRAAVRAAATADLEAGGVLEITYTGDDAPKQAGMRGAKLFKATYTPPF